MNTLIKVIVGIFGCLSLGGCYESAEDLIGDKATKVILFDSLVVKDGLVYYLTKNAKGDDEVCAISTRSDFTNPCRSGLPIKFERTSWGNYIVQVREVYGKYRFGLWIRSEPSPKAKFFPCVFWLGDGIAPSPENSLSRAKDTYQSDPYFQKLAMRLNAISDTAVITRIQLLKIAQTYEEMFYVGLSSKSDSEVSCINPRIHIDDIKINLEKDNRHLAAFEN